MSESGAIYLSAIGQKANLRLLSFQGQPVKYWLSPHPSNFLSNLQRIYQMDAVVGCFWKKEGTRSEKGFLYHLEIFIFSPKRLDILFQEEYISVVRPMMALAMNFEWVIDELARWDEVQRRIS